MFVECEAHCGTAMWVDGVTFAPDHRVLCVACLADKAFGGKDGSVAEVVAATKITPVPATPVRDTVVTDLHPSKSLSGPSFSDKDPSSGPGFYGGACKRCGETVRLPFDPDVDFERLDRGPAMFLCARCYDQHYREGWR